LKPNHYETEKEIVGPFNSVDEPKKPNKELREAMEDIRLNRNLHGPYKTVDEAMSAMMED
jgi:hypothetical protein